MANLRELSLEQLEAENQALMARKETEGRTPAIRQAQLEVAAEIDRRQATERASEALAGLSPEARAQVLAELGG